MKLSIVTVVMDEVDDLCKTRDSILKQQCNNVEWVVVHGGVNAEIVKCVEATSHDLDIKIISEPDNGIYDAMNKGLNIASGVYVVFLNAGDVFHDEFVLRKVLDVLKASNCTIDMLFGAAVLTFSNNTRYVRQPKDIEKYLWHGLPANHQATYYKKSSIVMPAYDLKYKMCGDYYIVAKMYLNGAISEVLNESLVDFKIGGVSYYNPWLLIKEAYAIQKNVLSISFSRRIISALKRPFATFVVIIIQNNIVSNFNKLK